MEDYALVIGINDYPSYRGLNGAVNDANDFRKWLRDPNGGGIDSDKPDQDSPKCILINSSAEPIKPLQQDVDEALDAIGTAVANSADKRGRRFYFYFSGHGLGMTYDDTALCTARWNDKAWRFAALNVREYYKMIMESGYFSEVAFFLDCCRTRLITAGGNGPQIRWTVRPDIDAGLSSSFIAYATPYQNKAFEAAVNSADDFRGYFTRALMAGLRGGAAISTGGVPASKLKQYIEKETGVLAKNDQKTQNAKADNGFPADPDPIFGKAKPECSLHVQFSPGRGTVRLINGKLETIVEGPADSDVWKSVQVNAGRNYELSDLESGESRKLSAEPSPEGTVDVTF
jgi:uncharacterized caspase-like protein